MDYFSETLEVLTNSIKSIDNKVFKKLLKQCNDTINNGNKIIVSGLGKNVAICDKFVGNMVSLGMPAYFLHTNSAMHGDLGLVKDGDLVIVLTKSGETIESLILVEKIMSLTNENINLWLLTFNKKSTLAKKVKNQIVINLSHEGDLWNLVPINSSTMNLIFLQVLVVELSKLRNVSIDTFRRNHPGGHIGQLLEEKNEQ